MMFAWMKAIWLFKQRSFAGPQLLNYLVIYVYMNNIWFPYGVNAAHSNYRTWTGLYAGHSCLRRQQILLKYFSLTRSAIEKISRDQITKIYFKPNDELEIKLNRMTCQYLEVINFHYCSDWTLYVCSVFSAPAQTFLSRLLYTRMVNYVIK